MSHNVPKESLSSLKVEKHLSDSAVDIGLVMRILRRLAVLMNGSCKSVSKLDLVFFWWAEAQPKLALAHPIDSSSNLIFYL